MLSRSSEGRYASGEVFEGLSDFGVIRLYEAGDSAYEIMFETACGRLVGNESADPDRDG